MEARFSVSILALALLGASVVLVAAMIRALVLGRRWPWVVMGAIFCLMVLGTGMFLVAVPTKYVANRQLTPARSATHHDRLSPDRNSAEDSGSAPDFEEIKEFSSPDDLEGAPVKSSSQAKLSDDKPPQHSPKKDAESIEKGTAQPKPVHSKDAPAAAQVEKTTPASDTDSIAAQEKVVRKPWVAWQAGTLHSNGDRLEIMVHVGPFATRAECDQDLDHELRDPVNKLLLGEAARMDMPIPELPSNFIQKYLVADQFEKTRMMNLSPASGEQEMHELYVLLRLDNNARVAIEQIARQAEVRTRLWWTGGSLAAVLAVLGVAWGTLRRPAKGAAMPTNPDFSVRR